MIVAAKHATAYQVEQNRFARNENITQHDLSDTFYPAWEAVVEEGLLSFLVVRGKIVRALIHQNTHTHTHTHAHTHAGKAAGFMCSYK